MFPREPRFIVDVNAGRLAKWLRVMGYDTVYVPGAEDDELVRRAVAEGRILLTRDSRILDRRAIASGQAQAVLLRHDSVRRQLSQVVQTLGLQSPQEFSRCIQCNQPLRDVAKEAVAERVPPYVYRTQSEFMECPQCGRVYWRGTHWRNMRAELAQVKNGDG